MFSKISIEPFCMPMFAERYVVKRCEAIGNVANLISTSVILVSVSVLKHPTYSSILPCSVLPLDNVTFC